jgi:hypothetical protein
MALKESISLFRSELSLTLSIGTGNLHRPRASDNLTGAA